MKQRIKIQFEEITNKKVRTCELIESGFNNENYNINDAYVLRVPKDNGDETISFYNEEKTYKAIEDLKISEKIVYIDPKIGLKISKFVHNARQYINTPTMEQINYIAKTLKKLHNSGVKVDFGYQMFYKLNFYKNSLESEDYLDSKYEKKVLKEIKNIFAKDPMVICHNDLVQNNMLFKSNGVILIDWEYSGMNNPYFDLASFISENDLNEEQEEFFLKKYFGSKLNLTKRKRVKIFINMLDILFYYWGLYLYKKRGDLIYYQIAKHKQSRILEKIKPTTLKQ